MALRIDRIEKHDGEIDVYFSVTDATEEGHVFTWPTASALKDDLADLKQEIATGPLGVKLTLLHILAGDSDLKLRHDRVELDKDLKLVASP